MQHNITIKYMSALFKLSLIFTTLLLERNLNKIEDAHVTAVRNKKDINNNLKNLEKRNITSKK